MKRNAVGFLTLIVFFCLQTTGRAQLTTATIAGTVADQTGAVMPGAAITAKNTETGISRSTVTGASGRYEFQNLPVGNYEVSATMAGFQTSVRAGIVLTVGRNAIVDLSLQVGEVTQTVTVTGEAALVEATTASVANLVDEKAVMDLPLPNRDLTKLVLLQPGVLASPGIGRAGLGQAITVAGARQVKNIYMLDGVSHGDFTGQPQGTSGTYMGAETVKEFQIITNNYSAAFQSTSGAVITAVTKSGTNTHHGSLFWYHRNDNLDAFAWESKRVPNAKATKEEYKRNMFGGSWGGPVMRDRTFFFGSYEGLRDRRSGRATAGLPTAEARRGILPGRADPVPIDPAVQKYIDLWPVPGGDLPILRNNGDGTVQVVGTNTTPTNDHFLAGRIDHQFSTGKAGFLSGTYNYSNSRRDTKGLVSLVGTFADSEKHTLALKHTSIFSPTTLNEFTFGYTFTAPSTNNLLLPEDFDMTPFLFLPDRPAFGVLGINNVANLGAPDNNPILWQQGIFTFKDDLKLMRGDHSFNLGVQLLHYDISFSEGGNGYYGSYEFDSWERFLRNTPSRLEVVLPGSDAAARNATALVFGAYVEDTWRVRRSLTLNLGLRYEFATVPKEKEERSSSLRHFMDDHVTVGPFWENPTLKSFAPRIGIAWAPGDGRFSLRTGFGVYYDPPLTDEIRSGSEMPPFKLTGAISSQSVQAAGQEKVIFPNALAQLALLQSTPQIRGLEFDLKNSTTYRWSFALQQELSRQWVVSADYTGSRGVHLFMQSQANLNRWEGWPVIPDGPKFWPAISGTNPINPAWSEMRIQANMGESIYHGLGLSARNRLYHGLQMQVAYTLGNNIDLTSASTSDRMMFYWGDLKRHARGLSQLHQKHNLVSNFSYAIPLGQNWTGVAAALAKGWQVSSILSVGSGVVRTVEHRVRTQISRIGDDDQLSADLIPGGNHNPVQGTSAGCAGGPAAGTKVGTPDLWFDPCQFVLPALGRFGNLGRGHLSMPGLATVDLSVHKNFDVTEGSLLQFRAEFFNLFNRSNFDFPAFSSRNVWSAAGARNPNAGTINSTKGPRTAQFGLRYTF